MTTQKIFIVSALVIAALIAGCTNPELNNPLDTKATNFVGPEKGSDDDGDGIANMFDKDSPYYIQTDFEKPTLVLNGTDTVVIAKDDPRGILNALSCTATDNEDGTITDQIEKSGQVFTSKCGIYDLHYTVADMAGNADTATRTVIVDCEGPEITLAGENRVLLNVGESYIEPGATAVDNFDGTVPVQIGAGVNTAAAGTDTVYYTATDSVGNTTTKFRLVMKIDSETEDKLMPVITLNGSSTMTLVIGQNYIEPGATAEDNVDGDLTSLIEITGTVSTTQAGTDTITYSVADAAGNVATAQRIVKIIDPNTDTDIEPPRITLLGQNPMTLLLGTAYEEPGFDAYDIVDGNVSANVNVTGTVATDVVGANQITYTVSDEAGNESSVVRIVNVIEPEIEDSVAPIIELQGCVSCSVSVGDPFVDPGATVIDNVDGDLSGSVVAAVTDASSAQVPIETFTATTGTYTITYTVSDASGNAATPATRTVIVADTSGTPNQTGDEITLEQGVILSGDNTKTYLIEQYKQSDGYTPSQLAIEIMNDNGSQLAGSITINGETHELADMYYNSFLISNEDAIITTNVTGDFKIKFSSR